MTSFLYIDCAFALVAILAFGVSLLVPKEAVKSVTKKSPAALVAAGGIINATFSVLKTCSFFKREQYKSLAETPQSSPIALHSVVVVIDDSPTRAESQSEIKFSPCDVQSNEGKPSGLNQAPSSFVAAAAAASASKTATLSRQPSAKRKLDTVSDRADNSFANLYAKSYPMTKPKRNSEVFTAPPKAAEPPSTTSTCETAAMIDVKVSDGRSSILTPKQTNQKPPEPRDTSRKEQSRRPSKMKKSLSLASLKKCPDSQLLGILGQLEMIAQSPRYDPTSTIKLKEMLAFVNDEENLKRASKVALMRNWMTEFLA